MSTDHTARKDNYLNGSCLSTASRTRLAEINCHGRGSRLRNLDRRSNRMVRRFCVLLNWNKRRASETTKTCILR
jgi:hypothetical protein